MVPSHATLVKSISMKSHEVSTIFTLFSFKKFYSHIYPPKPSTIQMKSILCYSFFLFLIFKFNSIEFVP